MAKVTRTYVGPRDDRRPVDKGIGKSLADAAWGLPPGQTTNCRTTENKLALNGKHRVFVGDAPSCTGYSGAANQTCFKLTGYRALAVIPSEKGVKAPLSPKRTGPAVCSPTARHAEGALASADIGTQIAKNPDTQVWVGWGDWLRHNEGAVGDDEAIEQAREEGRVTWGRGTADTFVAADEGVYCKLSRLEGIVQAMAQKEREGHELRGLANPLGEGVSEVTGTRPAPMPEPGGERGYDPVLPSVRPRDRGSVAGNRAIENLFGATDDDQSFHILVERSPGGGGPTPFEVDVSDEGWPRELGEELESHGFDEDQTNAVVNATRVGLDPDRRPPERGTGRRDNPLKVDPVGPPTAPSRGTGTSAPERQPRTREKPDPEKAVGGRKSPERSGGKPRTRSGLDI